MSNLEILEEKLKKRLLDPRVYCAMSGSSRDCFKTGYWCGAADALEETKTKCTEEVMENPDRGDVPSIDDDPAPLNIRRNSAGVYVPVDNAAGSILEDESPLKRSYKFLKSEHDRLAEDIAKSKDKIADLRKEVDSLQKKNLALQKDMANATTRCNEFRRQNEALTNTSNILETHRSQLIAENTELREKYRNLNKQYCELIASSLNICKVLDKLDTSYINQFITDVRDSFSTRLAEEEDADI